MDRFEYYLIARGLKPYTISCHLKALKTIQKTIKTFECGQIESYIVTLKNQGFRNTAINKYLSTIKLYSEFMGFDPCIKSLHFLKPQPFTKATMSDEEILKFLSAPKPRKCERDVFELWNKYWKCLAYSGCRPSELASVSVGDVNLSEKTITFRDTKTSDDRIIPIPYPIYEDVKLLLSNSNGRLFTTSRKNKFSYASWSHDFKRRCERVGINWKERGLSAYSLRHSFITSLVSEASLFDVQGIVGHKNIETTAHYYHRNVKSMSKAIRKHPLIRNADPKEVLKQIRETIESYDLYSDKRFHYEIFEEAEGLTVKIGISPSCEEHQLVSHDNLKPLLKK